MKKSLVALVCVFSFICSFAVQARVWVSTGGSSDGSSLVTAKPPKGINKLSKTSAKGGSIATASARSIFTKTKVTHGNKVVSAGTDGDEDFTHVNANSIFAGTATFHSDDGEPVENFTIDLGLSGTLKCKSPDEELPTFFSIAQMSVDVVTDGEVRLEGTATQDGSGPFSTSGNLTSGDFTVSTNTATIKKTLPINLGTLSDGQKVAFFFAGTTLVSYGADVPITYCSADFYNTDTFQATKNQKGKITIASGKSVKVRLVGTTLLVESNDTELLSDITNLRVIISAGGGNFTASAEAVGDFDENGVSDVVVTADNAASLLVAIQSSFNNTLFVFGETSTGDAFSGTLDLSAI